MKRIAKLQYITQDSALWSHSNQAEMMFKAGVKWVQLRIKDAEEIHVLSEAEKALYFAKKYNGTLIINDFPELAKMVGAHGVHLGLGDRSVKEAREILGSSFIIGGTANTFDNIIKHTSEGADYIGLGPFRFTRTKKNLSTVLGCEGYRKITKALEIENMAIPLIAIGGITLNDVNSIFNTGVYGISISGAILNAEKPAAQSLHFLNRIKEFQSI